ncbi:MAG: PIN domain-containing protein [Acidobacteriota bacterium]|nr:PIN domain-containing protein [Acidobacteriota bacterium]
MKYVLDTNTLSFAMAGDPAVCESILSRSRTEVLLPQPVVAEVEYGLARLRKSKKRERLTRRFQVFLGELPRAAWTDDVSRTFGSIKADLERAGIRIEDMDLAIAAHALARDATLVSDNVAHMSRITGLRIENWRAPPADSTT